MKIANFCSNKATKGNPIFQYLSMITGCMNVICSGMHFGWPSLSLPKLEAENSPIKVTSDDGSWLAVMPLIGAMIGSLFNTYLVMKFGRKMVIYGTSFPYIVTWLMVAFAPNTATLMTARLLVGVIDGFLFCTLPMYLGEIAEPKIRGLIGSSTCVNYILGVLLITVLTSMLSVKISALISIIFPTIAAITFIFMPETPYQFALNGDLEGAKKSLKILRGCEDVDAELTRIMEGVKESNVSQAKFTDLFMDKSNRKSILLMMGLRAAQQFGGTTAITFYTGTIFKEAGNDIDSETASVIYFSVQIIMGFVSVLIVDITGRKPLLIVSLSGAFIALLIEGFYFYYHKVSLTDLSSYSWVPVAALILYVVVYNVGLQPIPMLILGELFSPSVKLYCLAFADIYFGFLATIVSKFFQIVKDSYGIHVPFFVFSACCVLGLVFVIFIFPETKGKTLEEIQQSLKGKPKSTQEKVKQENI